MGNFVSLTREPLSIAVLAVLLFLALRRCLYTALRAPDTGHVATVLAILATPHISLADQLRARAACNQRLVHAFGLSNTFVSFSPDVHKAFKRDAAELIQKMAFGADSGAARTLRDDAAVAARAALTSLPLSAPGGPVPFHALAQCATLSVVLTALLGADVEALEPAALLVVAQNINTLWQLSKEPAAQPEPGLLREANAYLDAWVGGRTAFSQPLDIVVPAFETTWRVVAAVLAHGAPSIAVRRAFAAFYVEPTPARFAAEVEGASVEGFVMETLRLHPPTRRIAREVRTEHPLAAYVPRAAARLLAPIFLGVCGPQQEIRRADVEVAHQCARIWGGDAETFDAGRWTKARVSEEQKASMFAFGAGRLKCVAQRWAPMAVGVIVSAVLQTLEEEGYEVKVGERVGGRDGWVGWEARAVE